MSSKAKALLDDTSVSTRAVYQPRSAKRKRIYTSGISTAITKAQAYLAQPYVNSDQQSESTSGTARPMMGVCPYGGITNQQSENTTDSRISTTSRKAEALPDDTAQSTSAVYHPRSAKRKRIWHGCISTGISKATPPQVQPRPLLVKRTYNWHSSISTMSSKAKALLDDIAVSTSAVYQPRSAKRTHI